MSRMLKRLYDEYETKKHTLEVMSSVKNHPNFGTPENIKSLQKDLESQKESIRQALEEIDNTSLEECERKVQELQDQIDKGPTDKFHYYYKHQMEHAWELKWECWEKQLAHLAGESGFYDVCKEVVEHD